MDRIRIPNFWLKIYILHRITHCRFPHAGSRRMSGPCTVQCFFYLCLLIHLFHCGDERHAERGDEIGDTQPRQKKERAEFLCQNAAQQHPQWHRKPCPCLNCAEDPPAHIRRDALELHRSDDGIQRTRADARYKGRRHQYGDGRLKEIDPKPDCGEHERSHKGRMARKAVSDGGEDQAADDRPAAVCRNQQAQIERAAIDLLYVHRQDHTAEDRI